MNLNPVGGGRQSRVSMETFANKAKVQFHLNEYSTKAAVIDQYSYAYKAGSTNTADAIRVRVKTTNNEYLKLNLTIA